MDIQIDLDRDRPLRAQLEDQLRHGVRSGRLRSGSLLPSTRALAAQLGISRGVVVEAYSQLIAEGYLAARQGAATRVAAAARSGVGAELTRPAPRISYELRPIPDLAAFPRRAWAAATAEVLRSIPDRRLGYGPVEGTRELRTALAGYLGRTRGVVADPEHLVVTSGMSEGLSILWRTLRARGARRVATEDPGWRGQAQAVAEAGLEAVPVSVDGEGLVSDRLEGLAVDAVIVSPAHQFPTGAILAAPRRSAIVEWARRTDAFVVEDDYDAQYRYDREPLGAVQGLAPDRVVHGGSVSKVLAPALRIGWLLLPGQLVGPVRELMRRTWLASPTIEQLALARLIEAGELDRHLRRTRRLYRARRELLLDALARELPSLPVTGASAGLHVVLGLPEGVESRAVTEAATARGLGIQALDGDPPRLLVGYGALPEAAVAPAVTRLAQALQDVTSARRLAA